MTAPVWVAFAVGGFLGFWIGIGIAGFCAMVREGDDY